MLTVRSLRSKPDVRSNISFSLSTETLHTMLPSIRSRSILTAGEPKC
jgi:hypothetical protein